MAYITFQPSDYFNTKLYTGNSSTNAVTGVGFQPDFVWLKPRNLADHHRAMDAVRTASYFLSPNQTSAQSSTGSHFASFDSDGFTLGGSDGGWNNSSYNYVSWNWKANGSGSANTDGTINTTYTSANTTSGMSIIQYSGNGTAGATIGHGLGVAPKCVIIKRTDTTSNWIFGTGATGFTKFLYLNLTDAETTNSGTFNNTAPSSSVITLGSWNDVNNASGTYIAYCFSEKKGFSKFGAYAGNGNADGPMIYTGFKPAFLLFKNASVATSWVMHDTQRDTYNVSGKGLFPNETTAESATTGRELDIFSNGFKIRNGNGEKNTDGNTYIYMAFAEHPIVSSNNIPATAR